MLLSFATLIAPFLVASVPPLTDYPNHLARYWLISGGAALPDLAPFYRIDWTNAVTNVGVDWLVALSAPFASGLAVGHAAVVAATILPPLGMLALNAAIYRRLTPWQAIFPVAAWSTTLLMGFVNFQLGLGLALLFVAADPLVQPRLPKGAILMRIPLGLLLAADHLYALFLYGALLAGLAMGRNPRVAWHLPSPRRWGPRVWRSARAAAWCLAPLALLAAHPSALPGAQGSLPPPQALGFMDVILGKLATLFAVLASYNLAQELVLAVAGIGLFVWLRRRRALTVHNGLILAAVGLAILAAVSPFRAAGASWVDRRFSIMALYAALAALQIRSEAPRAVGQALGIAALGLACLESGWISWNWRAMDKDMDSVRAVLASVPAGATVLPVQHKPTLMARWRAPAGRYMFGVGDATFRHYDALAVPLRHAFVPNLFAARGLQPLRVLGDWDTTVEHNGGDLASVHALSRGPRREEASYLTGWRDRFGYVLVLNADMPDAEGPFSPPPGLTLIASTRFAEVWRVGLGVPSPKAAIASAFVAGGPINR